MIDWSELQNWDEYIKLLVGLLALADPIGNLTVILGLTKDCTSEEKKKITLLAAITFVVTLVIFTYVGDSVLHLFGISTAALKIAGGILFLFYALEMLGVIRLPVMPSTNASEISKTIGIVPIGIPLLAGPGTISAIIIYSDLDMSISHKILVNMVVLTAGILIYFLYRVSLSLGAKLGQTTSLIMEKIMGLLLAAIAVEFIRTYARRKIDR